MATRRKAAAPRTETPDEKPADEAAAFGAAASGDVSAFGAAVGDFVKQAGALCVPPQQLAELQAEYLKGAGELWSRSLGALSGADAAPAIKDRRFSAPAWSENPAAAFVAQMYLLNARMLTRMAESAEGDAKARARLKFAVQQWVDAASPANYLALNPEAQQKAIETQGESIATGLQHLLADVRRGQVTQTDETVFQVGKNVAVSEGAVVFENDLMQLIEYKPLTAQVYERPMLFVPPCINKFYILDLQPENSLIRHTVAQGHRCFVVSWRNPDESLAGKTWDDYIEEGPIAAIETVRAITGAQTINALGFCVGGTLIATALAVLAARGERPAQSLTLLTTLLDFAETGVLDVFVDEAQVQLREITIGENAPAGPGLMHGKELATTFSFLRPNDLVWNYVVANYLKGETPPPFDLLYWNGDSTNLPGPMFCWYLRHTYLQNELKQPGALTVCGRKVDLGAIDLPTFVYGSREDHIVPWHAAYASTQLLEGKLKFVLGASGHIAGVINPPEKKKRSHWVGAGDRLPASPEAWLAAATEKPGSWWPEWTGWLAGFGGRKIAAPKSFGNRKFKAIEPAPGRYVKAKA